MTIRRKLNEQRDYETSGGNWVEDEGYTSQVLYLLTLVAGTNPFYPQAGNRFLTRGGALVSSSPRLAEADGRRALEPLTRSGKISDVKIRATVLTGGRIGYVVAFYDRSTSRRRDLQTTIGG